MMLFSLAACKDEFKRYQASAKRQLENYAVAKGRQNYSENKWLMIEGLVEVGKSYIDRSRDKEEADFTLYRFKRFIDAVMTKEQENGLIDFPWVTWSGAESSFPGYPIEMTYPDENVIFECSVDEGYFVFPEQKNVIAKTGDIICWRPYLGGSITDLTERALVDITLRIDDKIIAHTVVEIIRLDFSIVYVATILETTFFNES
jgi:hypothetical protein